MKKIHIGILGSGFIVPVFIEISKRYKQYHLRAIWGRHEEKLLTFKDEFDYYTTDLERILNDEEIDVVYIALPNALHYEYALKALQHDKHVILEKPFTVYKKDAKKLIDLAKKKDLILFEAITTVHHPTYQRMVKEKEKLGDIKLVCANFSQQSRRYQRFKNGDLTPVFTKEMAGGALLDLNVYNIHFLAGMFGKPKTVQYYPNMEKGIDTSGILMMDYGTFKVSSIAGKDCQGDNFVLIEGEKGSLRCNTTASRCGNYTLQINGGKTVSYGKEYDEFNGWKYELKRFIELYEKNDLEKAQEYNKETLLVVEILEKALASAGLHY
ncbi:MAG: Gfo/Idh/MocA family oxidoreductase [Erysipelotrichaceae bacterium]|nr:Gfo/Idh/MocA family oxidoreductase [Erysipelotrichaceae bacterium]